MDENSIVYDYDSLKKQVGMLLDKYNRNVLVEEFIEGQDISMIYVEGLGALGPCIVECDSKTYYKYYFSQYIHNLKKKDFKLFQN